MLALGVVAALGGFVLAGRRVRRTVYRPERWRTAEVLVALSGVAVGAGLWLVQRSDYALAHPSVLAVPAAGPGCRRRRARRRRAGVRRPAAADRAEPLLRSHPGPVTDERAKVAV